MRTFRLPKVHPGEISKEFLETLGRVEVQNSPDGVTYSAVQR